MNRILIVSIIGCILLCWGCAYHFEQSENQVYTPPTIKYQPRLLYPSDAQAKAFSGKTKVSMLITKDGKVKQADIIGSSGHPVLDKAAVEYCQNIIFNPATVNEKPISSRLQYEVLFNITEQNTFADNFIREMQDLLDKAEQSSGKEKNAIEKEILNKDIEFVQNMRDGLNFNNILEKIVSPKLSEEWKKDWSTFPLSFLLYHDFISRFPDYDSLSKAKELLRSSVIFDLRYIKETSTVKEENQMIKEQLLLKIDKFIKNQYPDLLLHVFRENEKINS